jgi:hypothetical protein
VTGLYIAFTQEFFDGTGPSNDSAIHAQSGSADAEAHEMIERYIEGCGVTLSLSLSLRYCRRHRLIAQPFPA